MSSTLVNTWTGAPCVGTARRQLIDCSATRRTHDGNRRQAAAPGGATGSTSAARRRFKCRRCDYVTDNQVCGDAYKQNDVWVLKRMFING